MGLIHLYCGNGKGKTTASLGLAIRAAGAGMQVVIVQFLKGMNSSETEIIRHINNITLLKYSFEYGFEYSGKKDEIIKIHNQLLNDSLKLVKNGKCDLLVLDEITYAYSMDLIDRSVIDNLILKKPDELELVLTGRNPADIMTENADYISEIKEVKHPFTKNISARKGVEF